MTARKSAAETIAGAHRLLANFGREGKPEPVIAKIARKRSLK
jgi:hypothetical protein